MNQLSLVFPDSLWHPSAVSARCGLFGVKSPPVENASVLEIDCADGGNLLSIAASLPDSRCVGVSGSTDALSSARALASESGLSNVELIEELKGDETFDYVFLRNCFSRVEPDQRAELISSYQHRLRENGILVVEQMCFPGWKFKEPIRDQIRYHTRNIEDPHEKMMAGRQYLAALAQSIPEGMQQYRSLAQMEWNTSRNVPDCNFEIEYLDEEIHPTFFHEFMSSLEGSGLQYLCDLSLGNMMINQFPAAMGSILKGDGGIVEAEQYLDFVVNRSRRVNLLCSASKEISRQINSSTACESLYFSSSATMPENPESIFAEEETTINCPNGGILTLKSRAGKAALLVLSSQFPHRLSFEEVLEGVVKHLEEFKESDRRIVAETLVACAVSDVVQIDKIPGRAIFELSEKPVASPLARAQASSGKLPYVSSLQHRLIKVDRIAIAMLAMLDGTNGLTELVGKMKEFVTSGELVVNQSGEPTDDEGLIDEVCDQQTRGLLAGFASNGLLLG